MNQFMDLAQATFLQTNHLTLEQLQQVMGVLVNSDTTLADLYFQ